MAMAVAMSGRGGGGILRWRGLAGPGACGGGPRARAERPHGGREAAMAPAAAFRRRRR